MRKIFYKYGFNISIQILGPILFFIAVLILTRGYGPETQGKFSTIKATIDYVASILLFGIPQGIIYVVHKLKFSRIDLYKYSLLYGLVISFLIFLFLIFLNNINYEIKILNGDALNNILISVSIGAIVSFSLCRALLLTVNDGIIFSILTIMPSISIFACVILFFIGSISNIFLIYLISSLFTLIVSLIILNKELLLCNQKFFSYSNLFIISWPIFINNLILSSIPFLIISIINIESENYLEVGYFSIGLYFTQSMLMPLTLSMPLLHNNWAKSSISMNTTVFYKIFSILIVIFTIIAYFLSGELLNRIFGVGYASSIVVIKIFCLAVPFMFVNQVLTTRLIAKGETMASLQGGLVKFASALAILFALFYLKKINIVTAASLSILFSEFFLSAILYKNIKRFKLLL